MADSNFSPDYLAHRAYFQKHYPGEDVPPFPEQPIAQGDLFATVERVALIAAGVAMLERLNEGTAFPTASPEHEMER